MSTTALVPELYVRSLPSSLSFYCDVLGFQIKFERPEECFAYLQRGTVELMLEEPVGRVWLAGPLEFPFGRGVNLQIATQEVTGVYKSCLEARARIVSDLEEREYAQGSASVSVRQFVVQDPDGYLLRFSERL